MPATDGAIQKSSSEKALFIAAKCIHVTLQPALPRAAYLQRDEALVRRAAAAVEHAGWLPKSRIAAWGYPYP